MERFENDPEEVLDACQWWEMEAEARVNDDAIRLKKGQFYVLTLSLMMFSSRRNSCDPLALWEFFCESDSLLQGNRVDAAPEERQQLDKLRKRARGIIVL